MRILVVDDSSTMRRIVGNCLKGLGQHEIHEACDGAEGMAKLNAIQGADLILTDWNMPNVNGLEFIKNVKNSAFKDVPIIMVTTEAEKVKVVEALKAGARNYVVKPFTPEVIQEKIRQTLGA